MTIRLLMILMLASPFPHHAREQSRQRSTSPSSLPAEIANFYDAFNFVALFSTPEERGWLRHLELIERPRPGEDGLPHRLRMVKQLIEKIEGHIRPTDSGMIQRLGHELRVTPAKIIEVQRFQMDAEGISVQIRATSLTLEANLALISAFEKDPMRIPPLKERLEMRSGDNSYLEIHFWTRQNGHWLRRSVQATLLEPS